MSKKDFKGIKIIFWLVVFQSILYLLAKLSPYEMNVLTSNIDSKLPFISHFIYFYISWYIMLFLIPFLFFKKDNYTFKKYIISSAISIIIASLIYFFFPTTILRGSITGKGLSNFLTSFIYLIDTPILNCFPSMHCLLCFLYIFYSLKCEGFTPKLKLLVIIWSILVILSTLFIKQHILIDVISALGISIIIYVLVSIFYKKRIDTN